MEPRKKPTKELLLIGRALMAYGLIGVVYYLLTSERVIEGGVILNGGILLLGFLLTQLKSWARKALLFIFAISATIESVGILASFYGFARYGQPLGYTYVHVLWLVVDVIFIVLLMKKSIREQFITVAKPKLG